MKEINIFRREERRSNCALLLLLLYDGGMKKDEIEIILFFLKIKEQYIKAKNELGHLRHILGVYRGAKTV